MILPAEYMSYHISCLTGKPYNETHNKTVNFPPSKNACDYCLRKKKLRDASPATPLLNQWGIRRSFSDIYHGIKNKIIDIEMKDELMQKICRYPCVSMKLFSSSSKAMILLRNIKQLVMVLLATGIIKLTHIVVKVEDEDTDKVFSELVFDSSGSLDIYTTISIGNILLLNNTLY